MKHYITIMISWAFVLSCSGADSTDITTRISEIDGDKDGKAEIRSERVFRGKDEILQTLRSTNKQGVVTTSRLYCVGGDLIMIESDQDGDGFFEQFVIYQPAKKDLEVFIRQRDGTVKPATTQTRDAHKKQDAAITEFWEKSFQEKKDDADPTDLIREMRKKVSDAEKEKTNPKE